ncbi:restriction-modification enzyme subunit s3a [Ureaplasma urealyticum serovar 10 str. ATCC 33699]|uniref:Restriction endonuclease subunit S n=2 Tax=Ureaplasma urealyticum TaxID=2130 RepID=A0AAX1R071_UREUR|nr:restriction endonuclease subunit S [Ureaplasma urealyticum]ACI60218.1 restriction-modification enzyme subunit s3a [Ureaplasma urealyticum serovar 10 str. ATCC 33699]RCJ01736.1 restriction endonuclease subunit S [Ureaplasma urealyticum]UNT66261.1 restriction endonuclease subunit S [Ureaplasma urealyticum]
MSINKHKMLDISEIISGRGPKNVKNLQDFASQHGKINWLLVKNLINNSINNDFEKYNLDEEKHSLVKLNKNELVYSMYATPGIVAINEFYDNLYINQSFCKIIPNENICLKKFLFYWLIKNKNYALSLSSGTTQSNLNINKIRNFVIYLPPIEEQNAIISIIEPLEKSIKTINLLQTKIGLFIEKTFNFINNNLANADLIEFSLKDLLNIKRGLPITEKDLLNNPGNYPLISASSKNNGIFGYFNDYMYDGKNITISMNGNAGCIFYQIGKFSANSDVLVLSNSNKNLTNIDYIYYLLKTKEKEIQNLAIGTTRFRLGNSVIEKFKVLLPNMEIQKEFSKIVEPLLNLSTKVNKIEKNLNECLLKIVKKLII